MANGGIKRWSGSAWEQVTPKNWTGSAWNENVGKRWSGSAWVQIWPAETVTLSGEVIGDLDTDPGTATAGIRFNSDGTVDKRVGGVYTQIDASTDWIIPNGSASADFDVRCTSITGTWTSEAAAEDVWIGLGSNREWYLQRSAVGSSSVTCTFEIRKDGGSALDTGLYSFTADIEI